MRYTLQDYSDVLFTGYIYELPENTQNIIKNLTKELGVVIAAAMAASTISQKPDDFFKHSNLHYNKRVKSDYKNKQRTDDSWKGTIAFKATKIEKKEGAEKLMNEIRVCLNKISNKNFLRVFFQRNLFYYYPIFYFKKFHIYFMLIYL